MKSQNQSSVVGNPIYWERQQHLFCGIHAVNNILQVPIFTESDFMEFARDLDAREASLLSDEARGATSTNYDPMSGNFSLSVLLMALNKAGLDADAVASEAGQRAISSFEGTAFLCHRHAHFFGVRRLHGLWFNLDSTLKGPARLPRDVSPEGVSRLAKGYTVYVITGKFPMTIAEQPPSAQVANRGQWFDVQGLPLAGRDTRFQPKGGGVGAK